MERKCWIVVILLTLVELPTLDATLIASSKVVLCRRGNENTEPKQLDGKRCEKKFIVALAVENGKVSETS